MRSECWRSASTSAEPSRLTAAQDLAAYTLFSGKIKKVHKVSEVLYNKLVPLQQAIYFPASHTVALIPRGLHTLPKLEQLQVNVSILTDPMGRPINNGKNFDATVTNTGFILSTTGNTPAIAAPAPAAVDALFDRGLVSTVQSLSKPLPEPDSEILP